MKRLIVFVLALVCASAVTAQAASIGIGAFAGMNYPVLQDDAGNGTLFGARAPVKLIPFLTIEPYWASSSLADKVNSVAGVKLTHAGFDETAYGANLLIATGGPLSFYPLAGVGQTTLKTGGVSQTFTTYNAGFGLAISAVPKVTVNIRGEMNAVVDGNTTRKFGDVTAGVSYAILGLP